MSGGITLTVITTIITMTTITMTAITVITTITDVTSTVWSLSTLRGPDPLLRSSRGAYAHT